MERLARLKSSEVDISAAYATLDWQLVIRRLAIAGSIPESSWPLLVRGLFVIRDALPQNSASITIFDLWVRNQPTNPTDAILSKWFHETWLKNESTRKVVSEVLKEWVDSLIFTMDLTQNEDGEEDMDVEPM